MNDCQQERLETFKQVREWVETHNRDQLRDQLDQKITRLETGELADPALTCQDCGKVFDTNYALAGHRQKHIAEEQDPATCETCGETFDNQWGLIGHQQKHVSGNDTVDCGVCGETFRDPAAFNRHKQNHLRNRRDPVVCSDCGKKCKNQSHLKLHRSRKHGDNLAAQIESQADGDETGVRAQILHELRMKHYRPIAKIAAEYDVPPEYVARLNREELDNQGWKCLQCDDLFASKSAVGTHLSRTHGRKGDGVAERFAVQVQDKTESEGQQVAAVQTGDA